MNYRRAALEAAVKLCVTATHPLLAVSFFVFAPFSAPSVFSAFFDTGFPKNDLREKE